MRIKEEQLMKFTVTRDWLRMEIKLTDLVNLFHYSPCNLDIDSNQPFVTIKNRRRNYFVAWIIKVLNEDSPWDSNNLLWEQMFEDAFEKIIGGYDVEVCDKFLKYSGE